MKKIFIVLCAAALLAACTPTGDKKAGSFSAKDANDPALKDLTGAWKNKSISLAAAESPETGSALYNAVKEGSSNAVMVLAQDGSYYSTHPGQSALHKWAFAAPDLIKISGNADDEFQITALGADTLKGVYGLLSPETKKVAAKVSAVFEKIKSTGDVNWEDPSIYAWKTAATGPETNDQIAARVRSLLKYNATVAGMAFQEGAANVNTNGFMLPMQYYNGSVALKGENPEDDFSKLFNGVKDAHTAYSILQKAFSQVSYPKTGKFIQEYAQYFKRLADAVK